MWFANGRQPEAKGRGEEKTKPATGGRGKKDKQKKEHVLSGKREESESPKKGGKSRRSHGADLGPVTAREENKTSEILSHRT